MPSNLEQLIARLDAINEDLAVYVTSRDTVLPETSIQLVEEEARPASNGTFYLLEVGIMKDVIRV